MCAANAPPAAEPAADLLPARMLNEFVYCPRLFYYEHVEGVFLHSADPKRLRKVFKACKDYGLQLSVFECDLTGAEKIDFESQLRGLINSAEDQVLFIALGPSESRGERVISAIGQSYIRVDPPCYVA
jgi:CRISPR/Cas system-associated endoribonuclease Cas2